MAAMTGRFGPLKVPPVGAYVEVTFTEGVRSVGEVTDHFEDGTGYVLGGWVQVHAADVDRWVDLDASEEV